MANLEYFTIWLFAHLYAKYAKWPKLENLNGYFRRILILGQFGGYQLYTGPRVATSSSCWVAARTVNEILWNFHNIQRKLLRWLNRVKACSQRSSLTGGSVCKDIQSLTMIKCQFSLVSIINFYLWKRNKEKTLIVKIRWLLYHALSLLVSIKIFP